MKVTFHEEAAAEVNEAAQYYEERAFGLGLSFLAELEEVVEQIVANPEACQLIGHGVRRKLLRRFPYSLLYVVEPESIRVMAVAHHKRRPRYWRYRL